MRHVATVLFLLGLSCALAACGTDASVHTALALSQDASADSAGALGQDVGADAGSSAPDTAAAPDVGAPPDAGPPGPFVEAAHTPLPLLQYWGAGVMVAPQIVTVTFAGETHTKDLQDFGAALTKSAWWDAVRAGYCEAPSDVTCVGQGVASINVDLGFAAAKSYTDSTADGPSTLQALIQNEVASLDLPAPVTDTLYVIYLPKSSKIALSSGPGQPVAYNCQQFGGYHNHVKIGDKLVPFALVAECGGFQGGGMSQLEETTIAAAHEIIEAATDPFATVTSNSLKAGFRVAPMGTSALPWVLAMQGGESADMCLDLFGNGQAYVTSDGYTVPRVWNNLAAAAGHDPCVPAPLPADQPYFNVAIAKGKGAMLLDVGETKTVTATAFSDAPIPKGWTVSVVDEASMMGMSQMPMLSFKVNGGDQATVNNGDTVQIDVTMEANPGDYQPGAMGLVISTSQDGQTRNVWPIWVYTTAESKNGF